ncbi:AraC family transcriptional regulator [Stomatohabitans albus]|uniref:helix-turn-helix transcriptional regulator n=1 Tax=Stomatohabitans albus TaxID=3110766 RepID=UPI00300CA76D
MADLLDPHGVTPHAVGVVIRAMTFLTANLGQPPTMPELAEELGYSTAHFTRMFSAVMGVSPNAWLATQRFKTAKELIFHNHASITDIGIGLGFSSLGTFSRRFHAEVGLSPRAFKRVGDMFTDYPVRHLHLCGTTPGGSRVEGDAVLPSGAESLDVYVGLFPNRAAKGIPETGTLLPRGQTRVVFHNVTPGDYWVLATAISPSDMAQQILTDRPIQGGIPLRVLPPGRSTRPFKVVLADPKDLPAHIVITLPVLTSRAFVDEARVFEPEGS